MTKAEEAAQWMWTKLQDEGSLSQDEAVLEIAERFGDELTYTNNNGNLAIGKDVLKHFRRLHGGRAEWLKPPDNYWILEGGDQK